MTYTVVLNNKEIVYGPLVEKSRFSDDEWLAICLEMMKHEQPDLYAKRKDDKEFVLCLGMAIDIEQRYEAFIGVIAPKCVFKSRNSSSLGC